MALHPIFYWDQPPILFIITDFARKTPKNEGIRTFAQFAIALGKPMKKNRRQKLVVVASFPSGCAGSGLRRCIGPAAFQVCLDALDYMFCVVRPLHAGTHGS